MHKLKIFLVLTLLVFVQVSCNTTDPKLEPELLLKLEDVSCTEAWLQLSTNNIQLPATINLLKNNSVAQTFSLSTADSLLYIDSLFPNQNYSFQVSSIQSAAGGQVSSDKVAATTLDTTSHDFTWQTFEFGEHSSSTLYDVAIIDENNIWAVGEIYMNDTLGNPDPICYNAVHWSGQSWELKKIAVTYNGNETIAPLKGIFVLPTGEIIFSSGLPYLPHGNGWKLYHLWDMGVLDQNDGSVGRIWGNSLNDLYFVGNKGTIVHYQNGSWTKIESGTDLPINDIWGINDDGKTKILALASNIYNFQDKKILSIGPTAVTEISNTGLPMDLGSIWFTNVFKTFVGGDGLYAKYYNQNGWNRIELPAYFIFSVRGNGLNDMIVCGGLGYIGHFNGSTWINYLGNGINEIPGNYYSSSIEGYKFIAVGGMSGGKAIAIIGSR